MNLSRFPRRRYTEGWTPMERLGRLSALMNGPEIWIKRDDLLGLSPGGNKTRKLEFVMADALAKGADSVITCGAVQSNHCRITLAAARKEGLECHFVIEERVPGSYSPTASGNNFLYHLMGVDSIRVVPAKSDMIAEMEKTADELRRAGKKPYIIPGGASNPLGALGYVACAVEILAQSFKGSLLRSNIRHQRKRRHPCRPCRGIVGQSVRDSSYGNQHQSSEFATGPPGAQLSCRNGQVFGHRGASSRRRNSMF